MDAAKFVFTGNDASNGNAAIEALMNRLKTVTDSNKQVIWQDVKSGIAMPGQDIKDTEAPAIRVFEQLDQHIVEPSNILVDTKVVHTFSLYCYLYILPDYNYTYADVQPIRRNITRRTIKHLNGITVPDPNGFEEDLPNWWFAKPQTISIDYTDVLKPHYPDFTVAPPWWLWRIDLSMVSLNTKQ